MSFSPSSTAAQAEPASLAPVAAPWMRCSHRSKPTARCVRFTRLRLSHPPARRAVARALSGRHFRRYRRATRFRRRWRARSRVRRAVRRVFAGNPTREWPAEKLPYASVYSGHQFGVWAGQLGDGRAIGLGEIEHDGQRLELQLKGAGRTPYSRMGDGRAVLRSSIREYSVLRSHASSRHSDHARVVRDRLGPAGAARKMETAAVVTRVAPSFVRFGHFEHFYSNDRVDELRKLADHVIDRFYPQCREADDPVSRAAAGSHCTAPPT